MKSILAILLLVFMATVSRAQVLDLVSSGTGLNIYSINTVSGTTNALASIPDTSGVFIGSFTTNLSAGFCYFASTDGLLYSINTLTGSTSSVNGSYQELAPGANGYLVGLGAGGISTIDPNTGAAVSLTPLSLSVVLGSFISNPTAGVGYFISSDNLYTFNLVTGGTSAVTLSSSVQNLAIGNNGQLVGLGGTGLYSINPITGICTPLQPLTIQGVLFGTFTSNPEANTGYFDSGGKLYSFNLTTGSTSITSLSVAVGSLAPEPIPPVSLIMHQAVSVTNGTPDVPATTPLIPTPDPAVLADAPIVGNGLVADGVTPLVLEFDAPEGNAGAVTYNIDFQDTSNGSVSIDLKSQLNVLNNGIWYSGTTVTVSPGQPSFAYIAPLSPIDLSTGTNSVVMVTPTATPTTGGSTTRFTSIQFALPPVVLVHGYNADASSWTAPFLSQLQANRPRGFVTAITYAPIPDNTIDPLKSLAQDLDSALANEIEGPLTGTLQFPGWAVTQYDVVGHSQGGLLARMLCMYSLAAPNAYSGPFGTLPFRSPENFYRGRFHRVITIGSPHNGSRMMDYLLDLSSSFSGYYSSVVPRLMGDLIQEKFAASRDQIQTINDATRLAVDPNAMFNLISAAIAGDQVPGPSAAPACYNLTGLCGFDLPHLYTIGQIVIGGTNGSSAFPDPDIAHGNGSDGAVDVLSQQGGGTNYRIMTAFTQHDVAHADETYAGSNLQLFGVPAGQSETTDPAIASLVANLLAGPDGNFGPFQMPAVLTGNQAAEIASAVPQFSLIDIGALALLPAALDRNAVPDLSGTTSYSYQLTPPANAPLQGDVTWFAEVFAPGGVTTDGISLQPDASDSTKVTLNVANSLVGDVILYAYYTTTSGGFAALQADRVLSISGTAVQTGITLQPSAPIVLVGETSHLDIENIFADGNNQPAFLQSGTTAQFSSSDPTIATVDSYGAITGMSPGEATITGSSNGYSAQVAVTVLAQGLGPQITSASFVSGTLNGSFSYQIVAAQNATFYRATGLPPGLVLDSTTGLIYGTPTTSGTYQVTITASNAAGADSNPVNIAISNPTPPPVISGSYTAIAGFVNAPANPAAGLVDDGLGNFWGTTGSGGAYNFGTVFKINRNTGAISTVVTFDYSQSLADNSRGAYPSAALVNDGAGNLWGTTVDDGPDFASGSVFKVNIVTGAITTVVDFDSSTNPSDNSRGAAPSAGLVVDGAGNLWGTTFRGGQYGLGTIFKVNATTDAITTVFDFDGSRGAAPLAALVSDGAGSLWGTTSYGGVSGAGTLFCINTTSGAVTTVVNFDNSTNSQDGSRGAYPAAALVSDGNGNFWGTTSGGGIQGDGTVFKINVNTNTIMTAIDFDASTSGTDNSRGATPVAALVNDSAGGLWGTTLAGGENGVGTIFKVEVNSGAITTAVDFDGSTNVLDYRRGALPEAEMVSDGNGYLWGTTYSGGENNGGTIFKINFNTGAITTVADINSSALGFNPNAPLTGIGSDNLWGTTLNGGAHGNGTIFHIYPTTGAINTVVSFDGSADITDGSRGANPYSKLVSDGSGNLWGTTANGGVNGCGTVFKFNLDTGTITTVVDFDGSTDISDGSRGNSPHAGLLNDGAGNLWGTTTTGGASSEGTVFKVNMNSGTITTIIDFQQSNRLTDGVRGIEPWAGLVSDGVGNFWGSTSSGGVYSGGTVFKINTSTGTVTTLVDFDNSSDGSDGSRGYQVFSDLVSDGEGNLWGVTSGGGAYFAGTVFKINASTGTITTVVDFDGSNFSASLNDNFRGAGPCGLVGDGLGNYWGTNSFGGANDEGTVFSVNATTGAVTTLTDFTDSGSSPGRHPSAPLSLYNGSLWGTTTLGGITSTGQYAGGGQIFSISLSSTMSPVCTVTPSAGTNGAISPNIQQVAAVGSGIEFVAIPEAGYQVAQWLLNGNPTGNGGTVYTLPNVTVNSTVGVMFTSATSPQTYIVSSSAGDGGSIAPWWFTDFVTSGTSITFTAIPFPGYRIDKWLSNGNIVQTGGFTYTASNITANTTVEVTYLPIGSLYTVTPSAGENGSISPNTTGTVTSVSSVTFTATPNIGYQVDRWFVNSGLAQVGGTTYKLTGFKADTAVEVTFVTLAQARAANGLAIPGTSGSSVYASFGSPETGVFAGTQRIGKATRSTLFGQDGSILVMTGTGITTLGQPSSDAALATQKGRIVLFTGLTSGTAIESAETAPLASKSVSIKKFLSIDGNGTDTFFLATLQGKAITGANNIALEAVLSGTSHIIASKGEAVNIGGTTKTISKLTTLSSSAGTAADGRWRLDGGHIGVRLTFDDKSQAIYVVPATATSSTDWSLVANTGTVAGVTGLNGMVASSFGLPGFSNSTEAHLLNLNLNGRDTVSISKNVALVSGTVLLAQKGSEAPDETGSPVAGMSYNTLSNPVAGVNGAVAFGATLSGTAVRAAHNSGIWYAADGVTPKLIARTGNTAPGGGQFAKFISMVLPAYTSGSDGPIFTASLTPNATAGITGKNNLGLWALDSNGTLQLLFHTGQPVMVNSKVKTVSTFTALAPAGGSAGAASGYDNDGNVAVLATFTDGTQALINLSTP